jgi:hypothetical protein
MSDARMNSSRPTPNDQRRATDPCRHEAVGPLLIHHRHCAGAPNLAQRGGNRVLQGPVPSLLDQVRQDLGVRLRSDTMAGGGQAIPDGAVILDDPVVHHGQLARAVRMGMGVHVRRLPMRRPAGVRNTDAAVEGGLRQPALQAGDLALGLVDSEGPPVDHRHARRVVAAILQPLQARQEHLARLTCPDVPDYSAHLFPQQAAGSRQLAANPGEQQAAVSGQLQLAAC